MIVVQMNNIIYVYIYYIAANVTIFKGKKQWECFLLILHMKNEQKKRAFINVKNEEKL